jgi:hypothetical protein
VIADPINDADCLGQLTQIARELSPTTLIRLAARHIAERDPRVQPREAVIRWIQSRPQTDDDGRELVRAITCDVPQRVRLLADDPNCVERAVDGMLLLEALEAMGLEPRATRALGTVEKPARHTGLVEKRGGRWQAIDLFPRRNARRNSIDWGKTGKDVLQGVHQYVGKPILKFYGLGGVADTVGDAEDKAIGREKKQKPPAGGRSGAEKPKGGNDAQRKEEAGKPRPAEAAGRSPAPPKAEEGNDRRPLDDGARPKRSGGWWGVE